MNFEEEIDDLLVEQEQLRAMKQSCIDFEKSLNEKISKFLSSHLGFKENENFTMLDLVARAKNK